MMGKIGRGSARFLWGVLVLAALSAAALSGRSLAATVTFTPSVSTVQLGDDVTFTVTAADFPEFVGGGFRVQYNAAQLHLISSELDDAFNGSFPTAPQDEVGVVTTEDIVFLSSSLPANLSGTVVLGTITFRAVGAGMSVVTALEVLDQAGNGFVRFDAADTSPQFPFPLLLGITYGSVDLTVTTPVDVIPLPAAAWLFGSALLGGAAVRPRLRR